MANPENSEARIEAFTDPRWRRMMIEFQCSRDAQIERDGHACAGSGSSFSSPDEFSEIHQRHYDELLKKIIEELADSRTPPES